MKVDWTEFKAQVDARAISIQYVTGLKQYTICAIDGPFELTCELDRNATDTTDLDDFEDNYKDTSNTSYTDSNGIALARNKVTQSGWHYQLYGIELITGNITSVVNTDVDNSDLGHATIKVYDSSDVEQTTQIDATANGVKTILDWEPSWDYEIIGGGCRQVTAPATNIYMHCVAVPDLAAEYGGSVPFFNNVNLKYIQVGDKVEVNGRTAKKLTYNATYHTNKLRFIIHHNTGVAHGIHVAIEIFRA